MSNVVLAAIGTLVSMLTMIAFSVFQLDRAEAETHGPGRVIEPKPEAEPEEGAVDKRAEAA
jgi:hypothetical protein